MIRISLVNELLFVLACCLCQPGFCAEKCFDIFSRSSVVQDTSFAESISRETAIQTEKVLDNSGFTGRSKKGYAVLIGTMVGSAALTTFLGAHLPAELQFTSIFLAQVSTLGVYVLGAPIWEPLSSKFRQWAFGISKDNSLAATSSQQLEAIWVRTQENYSLNSQMSRNIISQFIFTVKENFYQAYRAHNESNPTYSADQVAEAAYRMRILFRDISPTDRSVATAVNSAFTNHISIDKAFIDLVWIRIETLDADAHRPEVHSYYSTVFETWLKSSSTAFY
jgi:hypothetical protein